MISKIINHLQIAVKCNIIKISTKSAKNFDKNYMDKMKGKINASIKNISNSVEETYALAKSIADKLKVGEVILLNGDLGAGKTTFTKGLAKALEVDDVVTSPTFTFMKEYLGRLPLYHFDMYRVSDEEELYELGLNDYLFMNGVCVIEWNKFECVENPIIIDIDVDENGGRVFNIRGL